jgi:hypothetical protein
MWNLVLQPQEDLPLGVFENRVPCRTFVPKGEKVTEEKRKLYNDKFYNFTSYQIVDDEMGRV